MEVEWTWKEASPWNTYTGIYALNDPIRRIWVPDEAFLFNRNKC